MVNDHRSLVWGKEGPKNSQCLEENEREVETGKKKSERINSSAKN